MIKRIKCALGRHKYYVAKELTPWSRKVGCRGCKKMFAMNDDAQIMLPWDDDFENLYRELEGFYK